MIRRGGRGREGVTNEGQKRPTSNHNLSRGGGAREGGRGGELEDENDIVSGALALNRNRRIEFSLILSSIDPRCDEGAPMLARCSTSQAGIN